GLTKWSGGDTAGLSKTAGGSLGGSHASDQAGFTPIADFGPLEGDIAAMRMYESVLTAAQVQQAYNLAQVTAPTLDYLAVQDKNSNAVWESTGQQAGFDWTLDDSVQRVATTSSIPSIDTAYQFTGAGGGTASGLASLSGDPTSGSVSIEMWLKPDDLSGSELLFEAGKSPTATSMYLEGNRLTFSVSGGASQPTRQLHYDLPSADDFL
ncbi:MAG: hypothetical protein JJ992_28790, partial [Planctomycetes bacterium]|nr:hypothetical protein [Planctomycetota bacterium]